jgi:hypothetical protein
LVSAAAEGRARAPMPPATLGFRAIIAWFRDPVKRLERLKKP